MHDDALYRAFLDGDTASLDELMLRYGDRLWGYLNGILHDPGDAEDLMIESFARIMALRPRIGAGNFKAYLFRTGRNLALRLIQRRHDRSLLRDFSLDEAEELGQSGAP